MELNIEIWEFCDCCTLYVNVISNPHINRVWINFSNKSFRVHCRSNGRGWPLTNVLNILVPGLYEMDKVVPASGCSKCWQRSPFCMFMLISWQGSLLTFGSPRQLINSLNIILYKQSTPGYYLSLTDKWNEFNIKKSCRFLSLGFLQGEADIIIIYLYFKQAIGQFQFVQMT